MLPLWTWAVVARADDQRVIVAPYDPSRPSAPTRAIVILRGTPTPPATPTAVTISARPPGAPPTTGYPTTPVQWSTSPAQTAPRQGVVAAAQPVPARPPAPAAVASAPAPAAPVAAPPTRPVPAPAPTTTARATGPVPAPRPMPQARPAPAASTGGMLDLEDPELDFESGSAPKPAPAAAARPAPRPAPTSAARPAPAPAPRPAPAAPAPRSPAPAPAAPAPAPAAPAAGPSFDELMDLLDEPMPAPAPPRPTMAPTAKPAPAPAPPPAPVALPDEDPLEFENPFAGSADRYAAEQEAAAADAAAKGPYVSDGPVRPPNLSMPGPKACLDPTSSGGDEVSLEGVGLSSTAVGNALRPFLPKVATCLPSGSRGQFDVVASFQVACDGRVTSVRIEDPGGLPDRVVGCLTDALKKAPFPAHDRQGGEVVELPLHLTGDATDFEL